MTATSYTNCPVSREICIPSVLWEARDRRGHCFGHAECIATREMQTSQVFLSALLTSFQAEVTASRLLV